MMQKNFCSKLHLVLLTVVSEINKPLASKCAHTITGRKQRKSSFLNQMNFDSNEHSLERVGRAAVHNQAQTWAALRVGTTALQGEDNRY